MFQARFLGGEVIHRAAGVSEAVGLAGREEAGQTEKMFHQLISNMEQQLLGMDKMLAGVVVDHQLANMKQVEAEAEVPVALKRDCLPKRF